MFSTPIICMIFIKILKNAIQIKTKKIIVFDNMIADMQDNEQLNKIINELFIREIKYFSCLYHASKCTKRC